MHRLANERAALKKDYSTVNAIKFGLFSVDRWRDAFEKIASDQIRDFSLGDKEKVLLQAALTEVVNHVISTADSLVQNGSHSLGGRIKKSAINLFVNWDDLHQRAALFAQAAVREVDKPKNSEKLKAIVAAKLPELRRMFFILSVTLALLMLVVALYSPVLDIDARISKVDFLILGQHVQFNDQVIFFETRSIMGVVQTLLATGRPDSIFVGGLLLAFSILFPVTKLLATQIHLLGSERVRSNRVLHFLAFVCYGLVLSVILGRISRRSASDDPAGPGAS